jgi:crotonobetaine/carnitine-CoA ligase
MQNNQDSCTLPQVLKEAAKRNPDKVWARSPSGDLAFGEAHRRSDQLARGLFNLGVGAADRILVLLPDSIDYLVTWCALSKIGALEVPINTAYKGQILVHLINDSQASTLICHASLLSKIEDCASELDHLKTIILVSSDEGIQASEQAIANLDFCAFENLFQSDETAQTYSARDHDAMSIIYTSGTTGPSKGVVVTQKHAHLYASIVGQSVELSEGDIYYTAGLPFFHVAGKWGIAYGCLIVGATLCLPEKFSVSTFWDDVRRHGATTAFLLGAVASLIHRQPTSKHDSSTTLDRLLMVPLIPDLEDFAKRFDLRVSTAYGSTESGAPVIHPLGRSMADRRIMGRVLSEHYAVSILNTDDEEVPAGEIGEIAIRPKQPWITMQGYWNRADLTIESWRNLWFHTGDAGFQDEAGNFYFVDRMKDCIRRRGENVSSAEVEAVLMQHPSVIECAVVGVPSELTEEDIMAAVVMRPGFDFIPSDIHSYMREELPRFMVPRYLESVSEIPKTETGKLKPQGLRGSAGTSIRSAQADMLLGG